MYVLCTFYVRFMYIMYIMYVLCTFYVRFMYVLCTFYVRFMYIMYDDDEAPYNMMLWC